jgi:hypothetical protein
VKSLKFVTVLIGLFLLPIILCAQSVSDYLILQNIGSYKFSTQSVNPITDEVKQIPGYTIFKNPGVLTGTDHFRLDHKDTTYETDYESDVTDIGVDVQVTQHTGGDSDRWLLHEIEDSLRDGELETIGKLSSGVRLREINGNKIISLRGSVYRWLSNKIVVNVSYTDLQGNKPEPLEVIQAYLSKFPSTITITPADFKGDAHNVQWIKDEMERRLWLCDKWNAQYQAGGMKQADLIYNLVLNMKEFLNYRQKYYSMTADADLTALYGYQRNNDITSIQNKLTEYKTWWNANKGKGITLP